MSAPQYFSAALSGGQAGWGASAAGATFAASAAAGAVTFGIGAAVALITGIFAHHAAAVRNEADVLNAAVPATEQGFSAIVDARNKGQLTPAEASDAIDQVLSQYSTFVYSHGVKQKTGNGPDTVLKDWLTPWATKIKNALTGGGGNLQFEAIPSHAGFGGSSAFSLDVLPPSAPGGAAGELASTLSSSPALGVPWWMWIGALLLLIFFLR